MIDEKKMIEELNNYCGSQKYLISQNVWNIINNQPKVGEWIPCKVTMPKPQKNGSEDYTDSVWICTDTNIVAGAWYCFSEEKWYTNGAFIIGNVIAWMPLPEVYEERS